MMWREKLERWLLSKSPIYKEEYRSLKMARDAHKAHLSRVDSGYKTMLAQQQVGIDAMRDEGLAQQSVIVEIKKRNAVLAGKVTKAANSPSEAAKSLKVFAERNTGLILAMQKIIDPRTYLNISTHSYEFFDKETNLCDQAGLAKKIAYTAINQAFK